MVNMEDFRTWSLRLVVMVLATAKALRARVVISTRGEGVVSLAIGVLIMAFLGAILWVAFKGTLNTATTNVSHQVSQIGN